MKIMTCVLFCILIHYAKAQTITTAEFFIDTDPGVGNGTAITVPNTASSSFTATVPTNALPAGFHLLNIRCKDSDGRWGLYESRGFYISNAVGNAASITAAEYFIDADPGNGNATAIAVPSGVSSSFVATIPTAALPAGFHFLAIRTKNADGNWGLFETRGFYITAAAGNSGNITAAEYFIDTDPGVGNGIAITVPAGTSSSFTAGVPTGALSPGFHFLSIRTKDVTGNWGLFETRGFYISSATSNAPAITAAEYFIDTDPGKGNGTGITVPAGASSSFVATVSTNALATGFHFIAIRTRDADGKWGLFETRGFYISTQTANVTDITTAEYFIDTDPGVGNAFAFTITPGQNLSQSVALNVPAGTANGTHLLAIRTKNASGQWGLFETATFEVNNALPLRWLSFGGQKENEKVLLQWKTDNEINTSHFEVERSSDGITFKHTGTVVSQNAAGIQTYSFEDGHPFDGVNFYRLKQVDKNGSFVYSTIVKILFSKYGRPLQIYPNPAAQYVQLAYAGSQNKVAVNVYDANGRQVMSTAVLNGQPLQLYIGKLAAGKYTVQLSDGKIIETGSFIKQ